MGLRVIFAGTPEFAVPTLAALNDSSHEIVCVLTQPDRPSGRGRKLQESAVKQYAIEHQLPTFQPETLKNQAVLSNLASYGADVVVVVAYGLLLPRAVLDMPKYGCINLHPSLLPKWRGAAPIQHSVLVGELKTGVSIMLMNEAMDAGPIIFQEEVDILAHENSGDLHVRLASIGAKRMCQVLDDIAVNGIRSQPQDEAAATYASKIKKSDARIDWQQSAVQIANQVRAYHPWPVAETVWSNQRLRIWEAVSLEIDLTEGEDQSLLPGTIVRLHESGIDVATGEGILRLLTLQLPGGKRSCVKDFLNAVQGDMVSGETQLI